MFSLTVLDKLKYLDIFWESIALLIAILNDFDCNVKEKTYFTNFRNKDKFLIEIRSTIIVSRQS